MSSHLWDALASRFDTDTDPQNIPSAAADNVLIAWPVLLTFLEQHAPGPGALRVIDFGCGTGGFARALAALGHDVVGIDPSAAMIELARSAPPAMATSERVTFVCGDSASVHNEAPADVVTSVMTLQFVEDIDVVLGRLAGALRPGGLLAIAVFNPAYVAEGLVTGRGFGGFDPISEPRRGYTDFSGGVRVPTFIRDAVEYERLANAHGLEMVWEERPPFTEAFRARYPVYADVREPEHLILGFQKS